MATLAVQGARDAETTRQVRSKHATALFADLMDLSPQHRYGWTRTLDEDDWRELLRVAEHESGSPFGLWVDDAAGFVVQVLGESLWSKSKALMRAVPEYHRVAVPSCFSSSKTWTVSRLAIWHQAVHPVGTSLAVTIAPLWRQVIRQVWPEIRKAHKRAGLPGNADMAQMKQRSKSGLDVVTAYGIAANPYNEAAVQGIHMPHLLLIVDEAGGIAHTIGRNLRALLTGDDDRMIAIGNPATDSEGSWFEGLCEGAASEDVKVIPISAYETPNLSGERTPRCRSCPPEAPAHTLAKHLVKRKWVEDTVREHGKDSPYVVAKVEARFPKGGSLRILPHGWLEAGHQAPEPDATPEWLRLDTVDGEREPALVRAGAWIRLGVDVAADGGDELAIARSIGDLVTIEHTSAGHVNANAVDVAGVVLQHIRQAERVRRALGTTAKIRVKIDANGVGWGVGSTLEAWGSEGLHDAEIVRVMVSEATGREPEDSATFRPSKKRDEMWLGFRKLIQPPAVPVDQPENTLIREHGHLRLRVDSRTLAQLGAPMYGTTSTGLTLIESKASLKKRGLDSPDRGEAVLLAFYEPAPDARKGHGFRVIV